MICLRRWSNHLSIRVLISSYLQVQRKSSLRELPSIHLWTRITLLSLQTRPNMRPSWSFGTETSRIGNLKREETCKLSSLNLSKRPQLQAAVVYLVAQACCLRWDIRPSTVTTKRVSGNTAPNWELGTRPLRWTNSLLKSIFLPWRSKIKSLVTCWAPLRTVIGRHCSLIQNSCPSTTIRTTGFTAVTRESRR